MSDRLHIQVTVTSEPVEDWLVTEVVYEGHNFYNADLYGVKASREYGTLFRECRIKVWQYGVLVTDKPMHVKRTEFAYQRRYADRSPATIDGHVI